MAEEPRNPDLWEACPPGELSGMVRRVKARRRTRTWPQVAGASLAVLVLVAGGVFVATRLSSPTQEGPAGFDFGGITCREVQPILPEYLAGTLDEGRARKVRKHVAQCPHCGPMLEEMRTSTVLRPAVRDLAAGAPREHLPADRGYRPAV